MCHSCPSLRGSATWRPASFATFAWRPRGYLQVTTQKQLRGFSSHNSLRRLQKRRLLLFLPGRIEQIPHRIVDREVHITGEDGEPVVAVIRAGIVPRMHLAERNAHLLHGVFLLDPGADEIGTDLLDEFLQLVAGGV